jgi:hypothetical protein
MSNLPEGDTQDTNFCQKCINTKFEGYDEIISPEEIAYRLQCSDNFEYTEQELNKKNAANFENNLSVARTEHIFRKKRKLRVDGLRKKFKNIHITYVRYKINKILRANGSNARIGKLHKTFCSSIEISSCKMTLDKTLFEIYEQDSKMEIPCGKPGKRQKKRIKSNLAALKSIKQIKNVELEMKKTYEKSLNEFLGSREFQFYKLYVLNKDFPKNIGKKLKIVSIFCQIYFEVCREFVSYYKAMKPNEKRIIKDSK